MTPVTAEELKSFLGDKAYDRMVKQFGGRYIYINKKKNRFENPYFKLPLNERNTLIMQNYRNGMRAKEISSKYALQLRYTHNQIKKLKGTESLRNSGVSNV